MKVVFQRLLLVSALWCLALPSSAVSRTWTGAVNGYWSEANNWDPAGVPGVPFTEWLAFTRTDDAHRSMTNDLVNLNVLGVSFGRRGQTAEGNDYDYQLYGNSIRFPTNIFAAQARLEVQPNGTGSVTIDCPLIFPDGGSAFVAPVGERSATMHLNGPVTIEQGTLRLIPHGAVDFTASTPKGFSRIHCLGAISGLGSVRVEAFFGTVTFEGPHSNTFAGGLILATAPEARVIFDKTAGYVTTNLLAVVGASFHPGLVQVANSNPNQLGPATALDINGGVFGLIGGSLTFASVSMKGNYFGSVRKPPH